MNNLVITNEVVISNVYMVEMEDGALIPIESLVRHLHISSSLLQKMTLHEVFEKAKSEVKAIYNVKDWWKSIEA